MRNGLSCVILVFHYILGVSSQIYPKQILLTFFFYIYSLKYIPVLVDSIIPASILRVQIFSINLRSFKKKFS